ncbi:MAG TPA: helix-turn-helix domain-containing protein [Burkholderiaceae bacterium]|nr:helix-turn-helix domain-containing protein [Burkholderiaceae bacterium]
MDMSEAKFSHPRASCASCAVRELCLPPGLSVSEMQSAEHLVSTRVRVKRGGALYRRGDAFKSLYAVWLGSVKSTVSSGDAREQITGLHMAGEVIGFDGLGTGLHVCDAVALEDTEVCVFPYSRIDEIVAAVPALARHLHQLMGREIARKQSLMLMLGSMSADERLATFLLDLADRFEARGYSSSEFVLRMTRAEIGSFLGITLETVSRVLSHFARDGWIDLSGVKQVRITDRAQLRRLAVGREAPKPEKQPARLHAAVRERPKQVVRIAAAFA